MRTTDLAHRHWLGWLRANTRTAIVLGVLTLFFFGKVSPFALFFPASHEVHYHGEFLELDCIKPTFCFMQYRLRVGNTGSQPQEQVKVTLHNFPASLSTGARVRALSATKKAEAKPEVAMRKTGHRRTYDIRDLHDGVMVEWEFLRARLPRRDAELMQAVRIEVQAQGAVRAGDPQVTTFGRMLQALFFWVPVLRA